MEILNRFTGETIFNIAADTLQDANLRGAYLQDANLQYANLRGADLRGADLRGADLRGTYLQDANLQDANLRGAYLQDANLRGAYLRGADLRGADLRGADLRGTGTVVLYGLRWPVVIVPGAIRIGCRQYAVGDWENFTEDTIGGMAAEALEFWVGCKDMIIKLGKRADTFIKTVKEK